jgi:hypothetical protein
MEKDYLILKRASASRPSGEWNEDDYDVVAGGDVDFTSIFSRTVKIVAMSLRNSRVRLSTCRSDWVSFCNSFALVRNSATLALNKSTALTSIL